MTETTNLLRQIQQQLDALQNPLSETEVRGIFDEMLKATLADEAAGRKMRFGSNQQGDPRLFGTKFSRHNLGLADIEFLYDLTTAAHDFNPSKFSGPSEQLRGAFEAISEAYYLSEEQVREIDRQALDDAFPRVPRLNFHGRDREIAMRYSDEDWARGAFRETDAYRRAIRAMDTAESGFGQQLVGVQYVGDMWEAARAESRVFALLNTFEMTAPTAYLPVEADIPEMLFVSENTANNSSDYDTRKTGSNRVQVDANKFIIHQMWSDELQEDALIPFVPWLRMQANKSLAHYSDSLVLNADDTNAATGNINLDDADPADTKHYLATNGIRHAGLVDNTANSKNLNAAITLRALSDANGRMIDSTNLHDWGHPTNREDVVRVCDPETGDRIALLDEVVNWKIQNRLPLLPGQVAQVLGGPVISSIAMSKTEADGKVSATAGNNTKGQVVTFNRRGIVGGWRRRVVTELERLPGRGQTRIIHSLRMGLGRFTPSGAASGIEWADVIYNIDLS